MCDPVTALITTAQFIGANAPALIAATGTAVAGATYEEGRKGAHRAREAGKAAQDTAQDQYNEQTRISDNRYTAQQDIMEAERIRVAEREAAAEAERTRMREEEQQRQSRIAEGRSAVSDVFGQTFTPDFYDQQQQAFLDFQNPQLEDQYKDAGSELLFALTRTGLGQSSAMNKRQAKLSDTYTQAGQEIVDEGARRRAQTEAAVNQQKQVLMGQAEAAQDPSYMRNMAQSQSASLAAPQSLSNLGDVFATALSGITSAYDQEQRKTAIADRMRRASEYGISGAGSSNVVS